MIKAVEVQLLSSDLSTSVRLPAPPARRAALTTRTPASAHTVLFAGGKKGAVLFQVQRASDAAHSAIQGREVLEEKREARKLAGREGGGRIMNLDEDEQGGGDADNKDAVLPAGKAPVFTRGNGSFVLTDGETEVKAFERERIDGLGLEEIKLGTKVRPLDRPVYPPLACTALTPLNPRSSLSTTSPSSTVSSCSRGTTRSSRATRSRSSRRTRSGTSRTASGSASGASPLSRPSLSHAGTVRFAQDRALDVLMPRAHRSMDPLPPPGDDPPPAAAAAPAPLRDLDMAPPRRSPRPRQRSPPAARPGPPPKQQSPSSDYFGEDDDLLMATADDDEEEALRAMEEEAMSGSRVAPPPRRGAAPALRVKQEPRSSGSRAVPAGVGGTTGLGGQVEVLELVSDDDDEPVVKREPGAAGTSGWAAQGASAAGAGGTGARGRATVLEIDSDD